MYRESLQLQNAAVRHYDLSTSLEDNVEYTAGKQNNILLVIYKILSCLLEVRSTV